MNLTTTFHNLKNIFDSSIEDKKEHFELILNSTKYLTEELSQIRRA